MIQCRSKPHWQGYIWKKCENETRIQIEGIASTYCTMEVLNKKYTKEAPEALEKNA
jgi:hypothetical protein